MGLHHKSHLHISNSFHISQPSHTWVRDVSHPATYSYSTLPTPHIPPHSLSNRTATKTERIRRQYGTLRQQGICFCACPSSPSSISCFPLLHTALKFIVCSFINIQSNIQYWMKGKMNKAAFQL